MAAIETQTRGHAMRRLLVLVAVVVLALAFGSFVPRTASAETEGQAIVAAAQAIQSQSYPAQSFSSAKYIYCFDGGTTSGASSGGTDPDTDGSYSNCNSIGRTGFDCRGLALYAVYEGSGGAVTLPTSTAGAQYSGASGYGGAYIPLSSLQPGDLVFFGSSASAVDHVGIVVSGTGGSAEVISAVSESYGIKTETVSWFEAEFSWVGAVAVPGVGNSVGPSEPPPISGGTPVLNTNSGKCLDVPAGTTAQGTQIDIFDCNGSAAQQWIYTSGQLKVYANPTLCLDVEGGSTSSGTPVDIYTCNGTPAQQWTLSANGTITTPGGLCLDVVQAGTSDGAKVDVYGCNGTGAQAWTGPAIVNGGSPVANPNSGKCLDVPGSSTFPGTALDIYDCNGTPAQDWKYVNGTIRVFANECLDVQDGSTVSGAVVDAYGCNGTPAQQWTINANGTITTPGGLCLDIEAAGTADGTGVDVYNCNGSPAQQWTGPDVANGGTAVANPNSGKCLDVPDGDTVAGTALDIYDCNGTAAQQWQYQNGTIRVFANECLDVEDGQTISGTVVDAYACNGTPAQQWTVNSNGTITTPGGLCLDVEGAGTADGTGVDVYNCNGSPAQQWTGIVPPNGGSATAGGSVSTGGSGSTTGGGSASTSGSGSTTTGGGSASTSGSGSTTGSITSTSSTKRAGVSVDAGAYATDSPHVTLSVVCPSGATEVLVSNDGGFGSAGATETLAVSPTLSWTLPTTGSDRLPKTVYLRCLGTGNDTLGLITFTDDIVLDETAPTISSADIVSSAPATAARAARVEVRAKKNAARSRIYKLKVSAKDSRVGICGVEASATRHNGIVDTLRSCSKRGILKLSRKAVKFTAPWKPKYVRVKNAASKWSRWIKVR